MTQRSVFAKPFFKKMHQHGSIIDSIRVESTIYGGHKKFSGCTWLKQLFYGKGEAMPLLRDESLTLSDLKKDEVLKLA